MNKSQVVNGINLISENLGQIDDGQTQAIVDALKAGFDGVIVIGAVENGRVVLIVSVSDGLINRVQAGKIIQAIAPIVGGKGGGNQSQARGGGKDASKIDEALGQVVALI